MAMAAVLAVGSLLAIPAAAGPYSDAVMAKSPYAYYRFNETSGTVLADSSGNGRNGTYVNAPLLGQSGRLAESGNTAVRFTATSGQYATVPYSFGSSGAVTIEAWFNIASTTNDWQMLLSSPGASFVHLFFDPANRAYSLAQGLSAPSQINTPVALPTGWSHLVVTADSTGHQLYVNGMLAASSTGSGGFAQTSSLIIGSEYPGGFFLNAWLDELVIYPRTLPASQILQNYQAASQVGAAATPEPGTAALLAVAAVSLAGLRRRGLPSA